MITKDKLHFHSDCEFFAGCERGMPILWHSPSINAQYSITLSYRAFPRYIRELDGFLAGTVTSIQLLRPFPDHSKRVRYISWAYQGIFAARHYVGFSLDVFKVFQMIRRIRPTVLHLNNGGFPGARSVRAAAVGARLAGCKKIIMVVNNLTAPYDSFRRKLDYPLDMLVARCTDRFVTASEDARGSLTSILGLSDTHVVQIPNSVGCISQTRDRKDVREQENIEPSTIVIGIVGLLVRRKGHAVFLQALEELLKEAPLLRGTVTVWFVGDGEEETALRKSAFNSGLSDVVQFLGYRHDPLDLIGAMDIVVLPSLSNEDSPFATIEAMALGKPVIATTVAGLKEQVVDGETGFLVRPGDYKELAQRIKMLIENEHMRHSLGEAGQERYSRIFSPDVFVARYLDLYDRL